jgi:CheY-like chemotaxis protein
MLHILLIEDSPSDVLLIREAIRTSPIPADVMIAYDGAQALRLLGEFQFKPDFILLDLSRSRLLHPQGQTTAEH